MDCKILGSNSGKGESFLSRSKRPDWHWGPHSLMFGMYWLSSRGIKRPGSEPNNSPVSIAEVKMISTKIPFVLRFRLNEQQYLKIVRVSGTDMYGERWAGGSSDWYSAVGVG